MSALPDSEIKKAALDNIQNLKMVLTRFDQLLAQRIDA